MGVPFKWDNAVWINKSDMSVRCQDPAFDSSPGASLWCNVLPRVKVELRDRRGALGAFSPSGRIPRKQEDTMARVRATTILSVALALLALGASAGAGATERIVV